MPCTNHYIPKRRAINSSGQIRVVKYVYDFACVGRSLVTGANACTNHYHTGKRRVANSSGQIRGVKTCMTLPALEDDCSELQRSCPSHLNSLRFELLSIHHPRFNGAWLTRLFCV